jgi:hypothetical protein
MSDKQPDQDYLKSLYARTEILKKPISGIVSGYHELPYVMVGDHEGGTEKSVKINGKIKVSPKLILTSSDLGETYGEVFDPETIDQSLAARLFSFLYVRHNQYKIQNEDFIIQQVEKPVQELTEEILDAFALQEVINTALIKSPDIKFYPISLERFINEILDREFRV